VSIFGHSYFGGGGFYMRSASSYGNVATKFKKTRFAATKVLSENKKGLKKHGSPED
jgi:hypothetical protein